MAARRAALPGPRPRIEFGRGAATCMAMQRHEFTSGRRRPHGPQVGAGTADRTDRDAGPCIHAMQDECITSRSPYDTPYDNRSVMPRLRDSLAAGLIGAACLLAGAQTLTIGTNHTPLDRKALEAISKQALRRLNLDVQLVTLPSARSLAAADAGEVDGEGLRVAGLTARYPNLLQVPEPYVRVALVAFSRDATLSLDGGWKALEPYRVAHIRGWKVFEAQMGSARAVQKVDRPEQLFQMLEAGHVDLALYTRADGVALARRMGLSSVAPLTPALQEVDLYLYLNRRHEALVPRLAEVIRQMKVDGSYNRVLAALAAD